MLKNPAGFDRACPSMDRDEIDPSQNRMIGAYFGFHGRLPGPIRYLASNLRWFEDWTGIRRVL
jgi:hypothetical protein